MIVCLIRSSVFLSIIFFLSTVAFARYVQFPLDGEKRVVRILIKQDEKYQGNWEKSIGAHWVVGDWGKMEYINKNDCRQKRKVMCYNSFSEKIEDFYCSNPKPKSLREVECPTISQWAIDAKASSQWKNIGGWSADQAVGEPDTWGCGDMRTAWATGSRDIGLQWIELTYRYKVYPTKIRIRETYNPGFVTEVQLIDEQGKYHSVWKGQDPTDYCPSYFELDLRPPDYLVNKIRIVINTNHTEGAFEEIDAVELIGIPPVAFLREKKF